MLLIMLEQLKNNAMVAKWAWLTKSGHGTQKFPSAYASVCTFLSQRLATTPTHISPSRIGRLYNLR